ncbi:hypothetical protein BCO18430_06486 [Burkholderia contaminans]|uniref:hypothetical protein n=1 Tax=Burkholderia contaminans TaxID=488447 RepID=UPI00145378C1|nr:hypothetical protein [Burkholderia contaminans]VWD37387.1 hypothetical protein BCO18430_06486 [Burkholderia contaminans]
MTNKSTIRKEIDDLQSEFGDDLWVVKHQVEFLVQRTSARVNNFSEIYFEIAQDSFSDYLMAENDRNLKDDSPENFENYLVARDKFNQAAIKTIVFSAMTCEAAIYDIAAIHLSDDYARGVLDRLDPVGKWLVAPRLICGRSIRERGPAVNALRSLFSARNELVHAKSFSGLGLNDPGKFEKVNALANRQSQKILSGVVPAYQAIVLLSLELERLLGTSSSGFPRFTDLEHSSAYEKASKSVRRVILRCKEVDEKSMVDKLGD